jgi:hypothetical protein
MADGMASAILVAMVIDHVAMIVGDGTETAARLRAAHGLGSERGMLQRAGTLDWSVPLLPLAALEFLAIGDRHTAQRSADGRRVLACEEAG